MLNKERTPWTEIKLKNIASIESGFAFSPKYQGKKYGKYPFIKVSDTNIIGNEKYIYKANNYIDEEDIIKMKIRIFPKGTIIFPKIGMVIYSNKKRILGLDGTIDNNVMAIIPNEKFCDSEFLYQYFLGIINLRDISDRTTLPYIKKSIVEEITISFPPLVEQRGIAEVLGTVDEAIRRTDAVIEKAEELKRGLMQRLLTRGIGHTEFKQTELGEIPTTWEIKEMRDVFEIEMGQSPSGDSYNNTRIGTPLLNGPSEFGDLYPIAVQWTSRPTKITKEKDLLFCVRGNTVGRINISNAEYCIGRGLALIREKEGISNHLFIKYTFEKLQKYFLKIATGAGSTFPNIKKSDLETTSIVIPDLFEQINIGNVLLTIDNMIIYEKNKNNNFKTLKRGMMQVFLSGKIRVELKEDGVHRIGNG